MQRIRNISLIFFFAFSLYALAQSSVPHHPATDSFDELNKLIGLDRVKQEIIETKQGQ